MKKSSQQSFEFMAASSKYISIFRYADTFAMSKVAKSIGVPDYKQLKSHDLLRIRHYQINLTITKLHPHFTIMMRPHQQHPISLCKTTSKEPSGFDRMSFLYPPPHA